MGLIHPRLLPMISPSPIRWSGWGAIFVENYTYYRADGETLRADGAILRSLNQTWFRVNGEVLRADGKILRQL